MKKVAGRIVRCLILGVSLISSWGLSSSSAFGQPANDNFVQPRLLFGDTGTITGNNEGATKEAGELDEASPLNGASVWFSWTAEADGVITFDTLGSDFDTLIEIYNGYDGGVFTDVSSLEPPIAANDDVNAATFGLQNATGVSSVTTNVVAGNVYYIVVGGFDGDTGSYHLNWKRGGLRASGEFEFTSTNYFTTHNESFLDYSDANGNQSVNRDVPGVLITVTRKNGSSGRVLVDYETRDIVPDPLFPGPVPAIGLDFENPSTNTGPFDYIATRGTLVFEEYQMSASFVVPIFPKFQGSGSNFYSAFHVALTNAELDPSEDTNELAAPFPSPDHSMAIVGIADPNPFPNGIHEVDPTLFNQGGVVQFERAHYRRTEGVGVARIKVIRDGGTPQQLQGSVTVEYQINRANINGDPRSSYNDFPLSAGSDYARPDTEDFGDYVVEPQIRTLTIGPAGFAFIDVPIIDDSSAEFNEDIIIQLIGRQNSPSPVYVPPTDTAIASGYEIGFQDVAILTIMHDDYPAGALDPSHNPDYDVNTSPALNPAPGTDGSVYAVAVQPDGKTIIGGNFQNYNGNSRPGIARMNFDGSVDTTFNPGGGANGFVASIVLAPDGKILIGGGFTSYSGTTSKSLARLNSNGTLDNTFDIGAGANGIVRSVALQADGKILVAGEFTSFDGVTRNRVARLNADGSVDDTFNPGGGPNGTVFSVAAEIDGSVLIGGDFDKVSGLDRSNLARLSANGSVAGTLGTGVGLNGPVYSIVPQPNGRILVGGAFSSFDFVPRSSIVRLNQNGSLDTSFDCGSGANDVVNAIALQPDGKILLGGSFTSVNGTRRMGVARLFAHGPVDTSFMDTAYNQFAGLVNSYDNLAVNPRNSVFALGLESDGDVIIGGSFSKVGGGRGSKDVRPDQYGEIDFFDGGNFLDENTRATYRNRSNVARLIGGATPGPGNIEFSADTYAVDQNASPLFVTLVRTNYTTDTNYLGAVMASFATRVSAGTSAASEEDVSLSAQYGNPRWGSSWNRTNKLAYTRMQSDGFFGQNGGTLPFTDRYNDNGVFPLDGEAFVFLDIAPDAADDGDKVVQLELTRPKGARIYDNSGFSPLDNENTDRLSFGLSPYFYFEPRDNNFLNTVHTDANMDWSLGGEVIPLGTALGRSSATLTIRGNANRGVLSFTEPEFVVNEDGTNAVIYVTRTGGEQSSITVQFATADGASPLPLDERAIRNSDYTSTSGQLNFVQGGTNKLAIYVPIINDTSREKDQFFTVRVFNPSAGATIGGNAAVPVRIIDDDYAPGHLEFTLDSFPAREEEGSAVVVVRRKGGNSGTVSVQYSTVAGGTAIEGEDYTGVTNTLTWNNGDVSNKTFVVPIANDGLVEEINPKTIFLRLTNTTLNGFPDTNVLGQKINAQIEIQDDDAYGNFGFSAATYIANENSGSYLVTITRANGSAGIVSLQLTVDNAGTVTSTNLFFVPGEVSKGISIPIVDNVVENPNLNIQLGLSDISPTNAIITRANATLLVVDDESNNVPPGNVDTTFNLSGGLNDFVYALAVQPDNKILVGGDFTLANNLPRNRIARLNANGTTDGNFSSAGLNAGANGSVRAIAPQANGRILVGGFFTSINGAGRNRIARLNSNGSLDISFNPGSGADNPIYAITETFIGGVSKIFAAGNFTTFDGVSRNGIVLLNANGTVDPSFDPGTGINGTNGTIYCMAVQSDGKVVLGGDFLVFDDVSRAHIVRLNTNGTVDLSFNPGAGPNGSVRSIAIQSDGKIVIGGLFTDINGTSVGRIARLNPNGSLDAGFMAGVGANDSVSAVALQADGKIVVGGEFTQASGVTRNRLTRLNADGTVDPTINFGTGADDFVAAVAIQADGKIVLGGGFNEFDGITQPRIARIHGRSIQGDGKLEFVSANFVVDENGTNALITVRRTGGTGSDAVGPVYVDASTQDGTALNGFDYIGVTNQLMFPVGETRQSFIVPILNDDLVEPGETVNLILSNPTDAALGDQPIATLTIVNEDSAISFLSSTYRFAENVPGGNALIDVVRTGSSIGTASVDLIVKTNGSATPDVDFIFPTNVITVVFADGETSQRVSIPFLNDPIIEGDETISLELSNVFGAILSVPVTATLTIVDDDFGPGDLMFAQPTYSVDENGLIANIAVTRTNGSTGFITAKYSTISGGTAVAGEDYAPTNGTISFDAGELTKSFSVRIIDDTAPEGNETVQLLLSNPTGGATIVGTNTAPLVIVDNEIVLNFSTPAYVVKENDGGVTLTVRRDSGTNGAVTVSYETTDITATNNADYIGKTNTPVTTNTLVFAPGETFKTFTIPVLEDSLVEGDETFSVRLFNPSLGAQLGSPSNAVVTIVDDDSSFSFSTNNFVVDEGGTNAVITVVRTNTSVGIATVEFVLSNATAVAGADFLVGTNVTLTFLDGEILQTILVPIVDDASVEGPETFTVHLRNPGGSAVVGSPNPTTVTIIDNDAGIRFSSPVYAVSESGVSMNIDVLRTTLTNTTVSVNYVTTNGTATDGQDFVGASGLLTFTNGETVKTINIPIIDDTTIEGDETVLLSLLNPSVGSGIINPGAAVLTILDNDGSLIVPAGSSLISESGPANGVIDASENVSLYFAFRNTVGANTANLVATLLPGNGITSPSGPQNYGSLIVGGASVSRPFSFTASGTNGQQIMATFQLQDGSFDLGTATFSYTLGSTAVTFTNSTPIVINDSSSPPTMATPYPSSIEVSGVLGAVTKVTVTLSNLNHSFPDDVDILLVSPSGQKIVLMSDAGGGSANPISNRIITFDDFAPGFLPDSTLISSGTFRPSDYTSTPADSYPVPAPAGPYSSTLSVLNGTNPNGTWSLYVVDDTFFNSGSIAQGWSLSITASSSLTPFADLAIAVTDTPDPAATNNILTYRYFVTNHGPSAATGILISNALPAGVTYVSDTCDCTLTNNVLLYPAGSLPKDGVVVFDVVVTPNSVGLITNSARVSANEFDPNLLNNIAAAITTVDVPRADLAVSLTDSPDPVQVNSDLTYSLVVSNLGPALANNVSLTNLLAPGAILISANASGATINTNVAGMVTFEWAALSSGEFRSATVVTRQPAPGTITNIATAGSSVIDPLKGNNTASIKTSVELPPLDLRQDIGGGLSLVWGTNAPGYIVESTTELSDNAVWLPVTNAPVLIEGGVNRLVIDLSSGSRFYRLSPVAP